MGSAGLSYKKILNWEFPAGLRFGYSVFTARSRVDVIQHFAKLFAKLN